MCPTRLHAYFFLLARQLSNPRQLANAARCPGCQRRVSTDRLYSDSALEHARVLSFVFEFWKYLMRLEVSLQIAYPSLRFSEYRLPQQHATPSFSIKCLHRLTSHFSLFNVNKRLVNYRLVAHRPGRPHNRIATGLPCLSSAPLPSRARVGKLPANLAISEY